MSKATEEVPRSMREIYQKKYIDEVIGSAANWKVLVMDDAATRYISSALSMFDIMERRVTLVENLAKGRQPFPEMEVVYFVTPTLESAEKIVSDFSNPQKPRYGAVHIVFTDSIPNEVMTLIQSSAILCQRIKTFKEIHMDCIVSESSVYHFDMPETLSKLFGSLPDPSCPIVLGHKLANLCITMNEHPSIRYQGSSSYSQKVAQIVHQSLTQYKKSNSSFWCFGDDSHQERDRAQLLIVDRSIDPVSPLMHEYTYQAMVNDLLAVTDGVISYETQTNKGKVEKQAILNDNDELWVELRHSHIAKVIGEIKERMNDIIQNNAGAALAKKKGGEMNITTMAAAVKELPEYQQTMNKLGQHVAIAQNCMDQFSKQGLMSLSQIEQTSSTGMDEDGKEVKNAKLIQLVVEALQSGAMTHDQKVRLLSIYLTSHRNATPDERRQLIQASGLSGTQQQVFMNFDRLAAAGASSIASSGSGQAQKGGVFSFFTRTAMKLPATAEGEYADTRHVPTLRGLLDQLMQGELPVDKFPATGPAAPGSGKDAKSAAKSVRKFGANSRWGTKTDSQYEGGRFIAFVAGGIAFSEVKAGYDLMTQHKKEVIIGSTSLLSPQGYIETVSKM